MGVPEGSKPEMVSDRKPQVKLYVKRVFITGDCEGLLPPYLRFMRGIVDSEESGARGSGGDRIYLDPLDGSDNFLSGLPYYGSSIALEREGRVRVGIVANLAVGTYFLKRDDLFVQGSLLKRETHPVTYNRAASVGIFERGYRSQKYAKRLQNRKIKYRIPGAVALSLAYAHAVRFLLFEGPMRPYDVKAGLFMCEDLYRYNSEDLTLICHNRDDFLYFKELLLEDER